jgi:hypothetical protein
MTSKLKSKLKPGAIYIGDNGRCYCIDCAGASASLTGHDISGQKIKRITRVDLDYLLQDGTESWACDCGKVVLK